MGLRWAEEFPPHSPDCLAVQIFAPIGAAGRRPSQRPIRSPAPSCVTAMRPRCRATPTRPDTAPMTDAIPFAACSRPARRSTCRRPRRSHHREAERVVGFQFARRLTNGSRAGSTRKPALLPPFLTTLNTRVDRCGDCRAGWCSETNRWKRAIRGDYLMYRYHALGGASLVVLGGGLLARAVGCKAQRRCSRR